MRYLYRAYVRACTRTACNPAVIVLAAILALAVVCYIYRQAILTTLFTMLAATVAIAATVAVVAIIASTVRWYRRQPRTVAAVATEPFAAVLEDEPAEVTDEDVAALSREADWLADEGVELAWSPDGKSLRAKTSKR